MRFPGTTWVIFWNHSGKIGNSTNRQQHRRNMYYLNMYIGVLAFKEEIVLKAIPNSEAYKLASSI